MEYSSLQKYAFRGRESIMPAKVVITGEVSRIILSGDVDFSTQVDLGDAIDQALSVDTGEESRWISPM